MSLQIVILACLISAAAAAGCCTPKQWEGMQGVQGGFAKVFTKPSAVTEFFKVSYDAENQQIAVKGSIWARGKRIEIQNIYRFSEGRGYLINPEEQKCRTFNLTVPFKPACVPDSAKKLGSTYFGAPNVSSLAFTAYAASYKGKGVDLKAEIAVTSEGCIPISEGVMGSYSRKSWFSMTTYFYQTVSFTGITAGIKSMSVFTPPSYCNGRDVEPVEPLDAEFRYKYKTFHF